MKKKLFLILYGLILVNGSISITKENHCLKGILFNTTGICGWDVRSRARFSQELFELSEKSKDWTKPEHIAYAQDQEDIWLYENFFYGMHHGLIIESGALNGQTFSTSNFFEVFAGWTSIHIEADPENFKNLVNIRPNAININAALCSESKVLHYTNQGYGAMRGIVEFMAESFLKLYHEDLYNDRSKIDELPTIPCTPVRKILRQLHVRHVDLWILDLEGAEASALMGTNFKSVHFNVIAMECDGIDPSKNKAATDILEKHGFVCKLIIRNCICKHNKFVPSSSSMQSKTLLQLYNGTLYQNQGWI